MKRAGIPIEPPRIPGEEIEFFSQSTKAYSTACRAHIHSAIELLYVKEGSYTVSLDDDEYTLGEGDLILFCSNAIHYVAAQNLPQNTYYVIKAPLSFFINLSDHGMIYTMRFAVNRRESKCLWKKEELTGSAMKKILDALVLEHEGQAYAAEIGTRIKVMELLLAILREQAVEIPSFNDLSFERIYRVMRHVQHEFSRDVDEKKLAAEFGMSYSYFSRTFKSVTGMTFKTYLNRTRINKAEQLLCRGDKTISEIATLCGYNSTSYFISVYRSVKGRTPYKDLKDSRNGR